MAKKQSLKKGHIKITSPGQNYDVERLMRRLSTDWKQNYYQEETSVFESKNYYLTTDDHGNTVISDKERENFLWAYPTFVFLDLIKGEIMDETDIVSFMEEHPDGKYESFDEDQKEAFLYYENEF